MAATRIFEGLPEERAALLRPHWDHMTQHGVSRERALVTVLANMDHYSQTPPSQAQMPVSQPFTGEGHRLDE